MKTVDSPMPIQQLFDTLDWETKSEGILLANSTLTTTITRTKMINNNLDFEKNSNRNDNNHVNKFDSRRTATMTNGKISPHFRPSSLNRKTLERCCDSNSIEHHRYNGLAESATTVEHHYHHLQPRQQQQQQQKLHQYSHLVIAATGSRPSSPTGITKRRRPMHLFTQANLNCNDNEKLEQTPSSEEDNSPTEMNNCKRLVDKPPLVKRLTMGLLRSNEESRPLVHNTNTTTSSSLKNRSSCNQIYSNGYINEEAFEPQKIISSKFGDSCRQSLTAIPMMDAINLNDNSEFNLKKRYLRETSSANSSPKIFANRSRLTSVHCNSSTLTRPITAAANTTTTVTTAAETDNEEIDLKDAPWFQAGISRHIAFEILSSKSPGAFLVRKSTSNPGCYALTLRIPTPPEPKVVNYVILRSSRGYKIKGFRKEFSTLKALITHHSVMPELLPVPLALPRPTNMTSSRRNIDDFDTYDSLQMLLKYLRAKNMEQD